MFTSTQVSETQRETMELFEMQQEIMRERLDQLREMLEGTQAQIQDLTSITSELRDDVFRLSGRLDEAQRQALGEVFDHSVGPELNQAHRIIFSSKIRRFSERLRSKKFWQSWMVT